VKGKSLLQDWAGQRDQVLADPALAFRWAKRANSNGEYFLAIEIAESFLDRKESPIDPKLRLSLQQQLALAFARSGFIEKAKAVLGALRASGATDGETLGLLGSVYKALWSKTHAPGEKLTLLKTSRDFYRLGFEQNNDTYCGINAAALSVMLDDSEAAKTLAESTLAAVPRNNDYWDLATVAEANLILGRLKTARESYVEAMAAAGERWADIASTRRQCRQLCFKLQQRRDLLDDCFPLGAVGFFAGHMIDAPDRATPRFPAAAIPGVRERIKAWLVSSCIRFSYCSAACGGDILFLEMAQSLGIETHVLLPFARDSFIQTSVKPGGDEWTKRFQAVLENAASVTVLNEDMPDFHASSYDFTNQMISARAASRAAAYDSPLLALALWDGQPGDSIGGTASAVVFWARGKVPTRVLHPTNPRLDGLYDPDLPPLEKPFPRIYTADPAGIQTAVASLLFMRIRGYQSLREKDFQLFFKELLGGLAQAMAQNGWFPARYGFGGQYLFAWETVREAGIAATSFMSFLQDGKASWPENVEFSLCLHTAPVQVMVNPILNQYTHEGAAVSRLQALSESLFPGIVYATETFASLAAFEKIRDFTCEYSGAIGAPNAGAGTRVYQVTK
jgi:tetratricopeptide (TPR) repeat protein